MNKGSKHKLESIEKARKAKLANPSRFWLGKKLSEETKKKISEAQKGRKPTAETILKLKAARKNRVFTEETKRKMSASQKGRKISDEARKKMSLAKLGKPSPHRGKKRNPLTAEQRKHLSDFHKGEKSHRWKGGITPINQSIRKSVEYKLWRESVFKRDNYTCIWCGNKGEINADHIKRFSDFPELRFAIDNGRTLCVPCHKTTETYGAKRKS